MNIRELQYLIAVADTQHFGKAAQACYVSQPTLSTQLKKLEDELGVQIFERTNKQVLTTAIGAQIIAQARNILEEISQLKEIAKQGKDPYAGKIRIATIPTIGPYLFPHIIKAIRQQLPKAIMYLYENKTETILQNLKEGKIDAAILALPVNLDKCESSTLFSEPFLLAVSNTHPLSKHKTVSQDDLQSEDLLLLEEGHCLRDQALEICHRLGVNENTDFKATSLETLRQMVAIGSGITLLPKMAIKSYQQKALNIKIIPFQDPVPKRTIAMVWRKNSSKKICCQKIAEIIRAIFDSVKIL